MKKYRDLDNDAIYLKVGLQQARKMISKILDDPEYLVNLKRRAKAGVLAPAVEIMLWHYYYGKPQENVNVNVKTDGEDLSKLTDKQLAERMQRAADVLGQKIPSVIMDDKQDGPYKN